MLERPGSPWSFCPKGTNRYASGSYRRSQRNDRVQVLGFRFQVLGVRFLVPDTCSLPPVTCSLFALFGFFPIFGFRFSTNALTDSAASFDNLSCVTGPPEEAPAPGAQAMRRSYQRRYRLGVRTSDSQSENAGSIPASATKSPERATLRLISLFYFLFSILVLRRAHCRRPKNVDESWSLLA